MPRERSPSRDKAFEIYKDHKGNIDLVVIAKQLNISDGTVRGWKNKDQWEDKLNGTFQKNSAKNTERSSKKINKSKEPKQEEVNGIDNPELTDKQRLFCIYYIKYFNATKAAIKAGYSKDTAGVIGYQLLQKTLIQDEIRKRKADRLNRAMLSEDDIFQKYIDIAFSDITDYVEFGRKEIPALDKKGSIIVDSKGKQVNWTVNYVDLMESTETDGSLISEVKQGKEGVGIKLQDKMKALQWLADHMDLLDTATKAKLDIENQKLEIAKIKAGTGDDEETEDDGFINALKGSVEEVWADETID